MPISYPRPEPILKYFEEEDLWTAKIVRFTKISKEWNNTEIVTTNYVAKFIPSWIITMVLNISGYDYRIWDKNSMYRCSKVEDA